MQANPHKRLRSLYGARMMTQYRGIPLGELSPHAYAIAEQVGTSALSDFIALPAVLLSIRLRSEQALLLQAFGMLQML